MKKLLLIAIAGALAMTATACSSSGGSSSQSIPAESSAEQESASQAKQQEEKVIFDEKNVKVTFTGIEKGAISEKVCLKIENNSDKDITVQSDKFSVNDIMMNVMFSPTVAKGKTANEAIEYLLSEKEENKIDKVTSAEFVLQFLDSESFETLFESDTIKLDIK